MNSSRVSITEPHGVMLIRSDRFFVRRIVLLEDSDVESQVELAIEGFSPFPLEQLYYGFLLSASRREALVYAAYRKHLRTQENSAWESAEAVFPDFIALTGASPAAPLVRRWRHGSQTTVLRWDGTSSLPSLVVTREDNPAIPEREAALQRRLGTENAHIENLNGEIQIQKDSRTGCLSLAVQESEADARHLVDPEMLRTMDIREKEFLRTRQREERRARLLRRVFLAAVAGIVALFLVEATLAGASFWLARAETVVAGNAPAVAKIEAAQNLVERAEELSRRQLRPFEMLELLNRERPASVLFLRATTLTRLVLEVEAQTPAAEDISRYELTLKRIPGVSKVEVRDLRSRDGMTSFLLLVTFQAELFAKPSSS